MVHKSISGNTCSGMIGARKTSVDDHETTVGLDRCLTLADTYGDVTVDYVAVIALYLLVKTAVRYRKEDKREFFVGGGLLVLSIMWFLAATGYLANSGDGVMTYRYSNFMFDGTDSLFTVIKAVIMSPMKALFECVDQEKLTFIGYTLLPLLGLPLLTRRYERYLLLIPYILINLMSDYQYQHDIFFQYTYGSTACLIYMVLVKLLKQIIAWGFTINFIVNFYGLVKLSKVNG